MISQPIHLTIEDYWDYPGADGLLKEWWRLRRMPGEFLSQLLPRLSVLALMDGNPVAFMSCGMSNSIGVATMETIMTRPGLSLKESKESLLFLERQIIEILKEYNYTFLQTFCSPAIARILDHNGYSRQNEQLVHLAKPI